MKRDGNRRQPRRGCRRGCLGIAAVVLGIAGCTSSSESAVTSAPVDATSSPATVPPTAPPTTAATTTTTLPPSAFAEFLSDPNGSVAPAWQDDRASASALVAGDDWVAYSVYSRGARYNVVADPSTGEQRWALVTISPLGEGVDRHAPPLVIGDTLIHIQPDGQRSEGALLQGVDVQSGAVRWSTSRPNWFPESPFPCGENRVCAVIWEHYGGSRKVLEFDVESGALVAQGGVGTNPVFRDVDLVDPDAPPFVNPNYPIPPATIPGQSGGTPDGTGQDDVGTSPGEETDGSAATEPVVPSTAPTSTTSAQSAFAAHRDHTDGWASHGEAEYAVRYVGARSAATVRAVTAPDTTVATTPDTTVPGDTSPSSSPATSVPPTTLPEIPADRRQLVRFDGAGQARWEIGMAELFDGVPSPGSPRVALVDDVLVLAPQGGHGGTDRDIVVGVDYRSGDVLWRSAGRSLDCWSNVQLPSSVRCEVSGDIGVEIDEEYRSTVTSNNDVQVTYETFDPQTGETLGAATVAYPDWDGAGDRPPVPTKVWLVAEGIIAESSGGMVGLSSIDGEVVEVTSPVVAWCESGRVDDDGEIYPGFFPCRTGDPDRNLVTDEMSSPPAVAGVQVDADVIWVNEGIVEAARYTDGVADDAPVDSTASSTASSTVESSVASTVESTVPTSA